MGVDITFFAEQCLPGGAWTIVGDLVPNPDYFPDDPESADEPEMVPHTFDIPRCSPLFAILANVNNTRTAEPYDSIALPRGIPDDASRETKSWMKARGEDAFAASWLTLNEIDSFDWNRIMQQFGSVDPQAAHLFDSNPLGFPFDRWPTGLPFSYSVSRSDIGNARWRATYAESAGFKSFRDMLTPYERLEMVRYVFWLDR
ncbi:MAG: hypothetical protein ACI9G1_005600 [Pirellulaceae bacterium]|jgi:hypothetical protein